MPNSEIIKAMFSQAEDLNQKVQEKFKEGNTDEFKRFVNDAIVLYKEILNLDPNNAKALYFIGNKYYECDDFTASLSSYDKAIEILKGTNDEELSIDVRINRTGTLCELKRYDESIVACDEILADYEKHTDFSDIEKACSWIKNNCADRKNKD